MYEKNDINGVEPSDGGTQDKTTESVAVKTTRSNKPPKRTGWLKVLLASGGIAVTVLGTGLIAQRDAALDSATAVGTGRSGTVVLDLEPVPTAAAPGGGDVQLNTSGSQGFRQSQAGSGFPGALAQSRSSR